MKKKRGVLSGGDEKRRRGGEKKRRKGGVEEKRKGKIEERRIEREKDKGRRQKEKRVSCALHRCAWEKNRRL